MPKKSVKKTPRGRFLAWGHVRGKAKDLARFATRAAAITFAKAESFARETSVYVDDEDAPGGPEPIATYVSGMSMRI